MLYSIEQCDNALIRIDFELERLALERSHVVEMKKFLENSPKPDGVIHNTYYNPELRMGTRAQKILQIISERPGINGKVIQEIVGPEEKTRQVQSAIARLKNKGLIENRGAHGLGAAWYIKEDSQTKE